MRVYVPGRPEAVHQGDIFEGLPLLRRPPGEPPKEIQEAVGSIVISHACDFTKVNRQMEHDRLMGGRIPLTVAPLFDPTMAVGQKDKQAMAGKILRYFPLLAEGTFPDRVVDLWLMQPVAAKDILENVRASSLSDDAISMLQVHLIRLHTRREIAEGRAA